jgi:flagellar basal-body rod modification protein FlgD
MEIQGYNPSSALTDNNPVLNGELDREAFLQLLATQLQHQDPLEPASDVEFIQQMATFAQLEQQRITNSNLEIMGLYESSINNSNALNLVGKDVKIQDNVLTHNEGQSHTFYFESSSQASRVNISVVDADGREVYTNTLVGSEEGMQEFTWYGVDQRGEAVADGDYRVQVSLEDGEGNTYPSAVFQIQRADGISYEHGGIYVMVGDKKIPIDSVIEVYASGSAGSGDPGLEDDGGIEFKNKNANPFIPYRVIAGGF